MAKTPSEFPSDWHYEQHLADLAREIQGYKDRLAMLDPDNPDHDGARAVEESGLKAAKAELAHYSGGTKTASKRPKAEKAESR